MARKKSSATKSPGSPVGVTPIDTSRAALRLENRRAQAEREAEAERQETEWKFYDSLKPQKTRLKGICQAAGLPTHDIEDARKIDMKYKGTGPMRKPKDAKIEDLISRIMGDNVDRRNTAERRGLPEPNWHGDDDGTATAEARSVAEARIEVAMRPKKKNKKRALSPEEQELSPEQQELSPEQQERQAAVKRVENIHRRLGAMYDLLRSDVNTVPELQNAIGSLRETRQHLLPLIEHLPSYAAGTISTADLAGPSILPGSGEASPSTAAQPATGDGIEASRITDPAAQQVNELPAEDSQAEPAVDTISAPEESGSSANAPATEPRTRMGSKKRGAEEETVDVDELAQDPGPKRPRRVASKPE